MEKLKYLKQYRKNVELVNYKDLIEYKPDLLSDSWKKVFNSRDDEIMIKEVIDLWKKVIGYDMNNTIAHLEHNLIKVEIIKSEEKYSVLYTIKNLNGKIKYYEGNFPEKKINNIELEKNWKLVPQKIKNFYEVLHNGFYYFASTSMGLMPLENIILFDDYEWGILEDLEEPLQINFKKTFGFFENGMGGYVALDLENSIFNKCVLWFNDDQPDYEVSFWEIVDEWINIGLETD